MACIFNRQEWLEVAISTLDEYPKQRAAWGILRWYLSTEYDELSEEVLLEKASQLHIAWKLRKMVDAGLVEFDFERNLYRPTSEGREIGDALRRHQVAIR